MIVNRSSDYDRSHFEEIRKDLPDLVQGWAELNHALFWHSVEQERAWREAKKDQRLVDWWNVSIFGRYWAFGPNSFDAIAADIEARPLLDDRLVALTLAFGLFVAGKRPRKWRERLKRLAAKDEALSDKLELLLHPPADELANLCKQEAQWKQRNARVVAAREQQLERDRILLSQRIDQIRDPGKPAILTQDQAYLMERMRSAGRDDHNHWTDGNWRSLIDTYGERVATAFRDATVRFWREFNPKTQSLGATTNQTPYAVIFGLTGS